MRRAAPLLAAALLLACGDDGGTDGGVDASDGAADATDAVGPAMPMPVAEAMPPVLTPCPTGFREANDPDGRPFCDPWPDAGRESCGPGEAHFAGTPGCTVVGTSCPADGLPADPPAGARTLWVRAGAGGTGTRASPLSTVGEAVAMASMGDVIALGTGTYEEVVILPPGVTLYGACPSETIIRESSGGSAVVTASGADVRVANLTIGASGRPGADAAGAGRSLVLDDVIVESTTDMGVVAAGGGRIEARRVVIRDIVPTGGLNRGLSVESGGVFEGEDVVVDGAALVGLYVTGAGSTATIDGVALVGTREGDNSGLGVLVTAGGAATLRRAAIEGNEGAGGFTDGEGTTLVIEDSVLRGNLPTARGEFGRALNFERGAHGDLRRVYVGGHRDVAFYLNEGGSLEIEDALVRDTASEMLDERGGRGLEARRGSAVVARRVTVADNAETGVLISGESTLTGSDIVIEGTRGRARDGQFGHGLHLQVDASADVERVRVEDNLFLGVAIIQASGVFRDLIVRGTESNFEQLFGRGIDVEDSTATIERALIESNRDMSVFCSLGCTLDMTDVVVRDTRPEEVDLTGGRAIAYQQGGSGVITRALLEGSTEVAVSAAGYSGLLDMTDVVIRGVEPQACAATTCPDAPAGTGVLAGSPIHMRNFVIEDAELCGLQLIDTARVDLSRGAVRGNAIGACVQVPGYDFDRLTDGVDYEDNGTNLDTTSLPVPDIPGESGL